MGRGHEVTVTNDGATILKSVYVDNPAAKVLQGELRLISAAGNTPAYGASQIQQTVNTLVCGHGHQQLLLLLLLVCVDKQSLNLYPT
jgi:hypothetical protein